MRDRSGVEAAAKLYQLHRLFEGLLMDVGREIETLRAVGLLPDLSQPKPQVAVSKLGLPFVGAPRRRAQPSVWGLYHGDRIFGNLQVASMRASGVQDPLISIYCYSEVLESHTPAPHVPK